MPDRVESPIAQATTDRNRFDLKVKDFWLDNTRLSEKRRGAAVATALRNNAGGYLDFLAYEISDSRLDWEHFRDLLWSEFASGGFESRLSNIAKSNGLSAKALPWCEVATYLGLAPESHVDLLIGADLLKWAVPQVPRKLASSSKYRELLVQLLLRTSQLAVARRFLSQKSWMDGDKTWFYLSQIEREADGNETLWVDSFNRLFSPDNGLVVQGDQTDSKKALRFSSEADETHPAASRSACSVVVPVAETWELELLHESLRSIEDQTIQADEILLVVGDALKPSSFGEFESQYNVKVIFVSDTTDQGALLREGVERSANPTVFVQLPNALSHPRRFELQLADTSEIDCNFSFGRVVATDMSLGFQKVGCTVSGVSGASLGFDKRLVDNVGNLLSQGRKAADEFLQRLNAVYSGRKFREFPLVITRSPDGKDFPFLWGQVSERQRLIDSSISEFHLELAESVHNDSTSGLAIQNEFSDVLASRGDTDFDVVLAGDWRKYGGPQKSMIEEIHALISAGYKVAVLHMEAARFMTVETDPLCRPIQKLINKGYVGQVAYHEAATARLLVLRYPPILQVVPDNPSKIRVHRMVVLANQAPSELDGSDIRYTVPEVSKGALHCFGVGVTWAPQGPQVRRAIDGYLSDTEIEDFNIPGILNLDEWRGEIPRSNLNRTPVIGRHSRDNEMKWPEDAEMLQSVYPTSGNVIVRSMGGTSHARRVLGIKNSPDNWDDLSRDEESVIDFLHSLDYYVFFQHSNAIEAFGRSILEALAANLVVILQKNYAEVFGDAAIYADPEEVMGIVDDFQKNPDKYNEQLRRAAVIVANEFSYDSYVAKIQSMLKRPTVGR